MQAHFEFINLQHYLHSEIQNYEFDITVIVSVPYSEKLIVTLLRK